MSEDRIIDLFTSLPVASVTSRADLLRDGTLVDASRRAAAIGFNVPVALTRAVWEDCAADRDTLIHEVLWMAFLACARADVGRRIQRIPFVVYRPREVPLVAHVGPGDTADPVITIMRPEED